MQTFSCIRVIIEKLIRKNLCVIIILFLLQSILQFSYPQQEVEKYSKVSIPVTGDSDIRYLQQAGFSMKGTRYDGQSLNIILSESEIMKLQDMGFTYTVLIDDMTKYYQERSQRSKTEMQQLEQQMKSKYRIGGFGFGSMGGYYTFDEVVAELDSMRMLYPNLITAKYSVGTTYEGRTIWAVKISDNPDINEPEPAVFLNAMIHAREPEGMMSVIYFMYYLLENYGSNPEITHLVDNREFYFVPVLNADGYVYNEQQHPGGGGMWYKNRKDNGNGCFGVNGNRNFGYMWGYNNIGSSPDPCTEEFRGDSAFSEAESQAVRDLCIGHNFLIANNYHAWWDVVFPPWAYNLTRTEDSLTFNNMIRAGTQFNNYLIGDPGIPENYELNGDVTDWMYGDIIMKPRIFGFLTEVGNDDDGFWPEPERIFPIAEENAYLNKVLAWGPAVIDNPPLIYTAAVLPTYCTPAIDSVHITALESNPDNLAREVTSGMYNWENILIDNFSLTNSDSNLFIAGRPVPAEENYYYFLIKDSCSQPPSEFYYKKNIAFTTAGPVVLDSITYITYTNYYFLRPYVSNLGSTLTINGATLKFECTDPWAAVNKIPIILPPIDPGASVGGTSMRAISFVDSIFPGYFNLRVLIMKDGYTFWTDSMRLFVLPVKVESQESPLSFQLEQNYPNPFNPATTISYKIKQRSFVSLKVYDMLGNEITALVNEEKPAGEYKVNFDASRLASGVYFYKIHAGTYTSIKKMILIK